MKELKKGNKAPYRGFLLGVQEYETYLRMQELMPNIIKAFEQMNRRDNP